MRIEALIHAVRDYEVQQRYFVGVGLGMQVSLEPRWFNSDWQWYIGVDKGELSQRELRDLLSPGNLDWKLGSSRQVEFLFKNRANGIALTPVDRTIRALPGRSDWVYFEVPRQESPAWRDVQDTQTLAMRLKDSLILNRDRLQGEQTLVVSHSAASAVEVCVVRSAPKLMTPRHSLAVDPFLLHALGLLDRISNGQDPQPHDERIRLRALLDQGEAIVGAGREWELSKYALVSWIDEMLVDSAWSQRDWWSNNVMEMELFNTRSCNEQFYINATKPRRYPTATPSKFIMSVSCLGFVVCIATQSMQH